MQNENERFNPPTLIEQLDQYGATMGGFASVYAQYYKALIANGISHHLAEKMTRDFAWLANVQRWYPNMVPPDAPLG